MSLDKLQKALQENSELCIRKKHLTACLTSALLQKPFSIDSSLKPDKDESHLVRDEDCPADGAGAPNQQLQYGFALPSPSVVSDYHPTIENQI
ncbi:hypothetical protein TNCV_5015381 [Trichonephila clavipes]|nr:hypothetical protein TNCV_5015381 [Trichonephila clavipes]